MTNTPDLNGHTALVTGASRGIGAAIAVALAEAGAAVAVNYRERATEAHAVVADIKAKGGRATAIVVSKSPSVRSSMPRTIAMPALLTRMSIGPSAEVT